MKIVFIHLGIEFAGDSLERGPLGGTETALIGVSRALAAIQGNEVYIFTNTPQVRDFAGVHYFPVQDLAAWAEKNTIDVLVSIRQWLPLWLPLKSRLKIYFSPDAYDQPFLHRAFEVILNIKGEGVAVPLFPPKVFFNNLDHIFCVGRWQAETFVSRLEFPAEKIRVTANAVNPDLFRPLPLAERQKRIMYSATPFRGLDHLIRFFPEIEKRVPGVGLEVCSGMQVYGVSDAENERQYGSLYQGLKQISAQSHGSVRQRDLARIMCASRVYTYPNTFEETFCISVLEAQAAGLPVVTSKKGALVERITDGVDGFLIPGEPGDESYQREFVEITARLFHDDGLWCAVSEAAQRRAASQTYPAVAADWQGFFAAQLAHKISATSPALPEFTKTEIVLPQKNNLTISIDGKTLQHFVKQGFQSYGFHS